MLAGRLYGAIIVVALTLISTIIYHCSLIEAWSFRPTDRLVSIPPKVYAPAISTTTTTTLSRYHWRLFVSKKDGFGEDNGGQNDNDHHNHDNHDIDWRDFRARLVMQEKSLLSKPPSTIQSSGNDTTPSTLEGDVESVNNDNNNKSYEYDDSSILTSDSTWAYESGDVIEVGSLIVSHPSQDFAYGGLRQQYFYKSVVLVIEHSPTFTRGVLLNRPTDQTMKARKNGGGGGEEEEDWNVWFGGDVQGMDSDDEELICLHRLTSPVARDLSVPILKDIAFTSWEIAQVLVKEGDATKEDFWLCCGYAGWNPGQLQNELQRGNWFMAAFDVESIWNMIGQELTNPQGTDMWVQVMKRIGKDSIITSTSVGQKFQDDMLKQWVRQKILKNPPQSRLRATRIKTTSRQDHPLPPQETTDNRPDVFSFSPGTLIRASSPILLDEQVFHQSLVLILQNDIETTVGVVLNRPSSTSVAIGGSQLPVRYGGRFGLEGQRKVDMPELWLHFNNTQLQDAKVGVPISQNNDENSLFWKCTRTDAETAVEVGLAGPNDFMVVKGLSVWKKYSSLTGNKPSLVELDTSFSVVDASVVSSAWKLMNAQEPLNAQNAVENLEAANAAWMLSTSRMFSNKGQGTQSQEQQKVQSLACSALDKWIRTFLLKP